MSVAKGIDTYGIHDWMVFVRSYRELGWAEIEPSTCEFRSHSGQIL